MNYQLMSKIDDSIIIKQMMLLLRVLAEIMHDIQNLGVCYLYYVLIVATYAAHSIGLACDYLISDASSYVTRFCALQSYNCCILFKFHSIIFVLNCNTFATFK